MEKNLRKKYTLFFWDIDREKFQRILFKSQN